MTPSPHNTPASSKYQGQGMARGQDPALVWACMGLYIFSNLEHFLKIIFKKWLDLVKSLARKTQIIADPCFSTKLF